MLYTYDYDLDYLPAMPMVTIQIGKPDAEANVAFSALVDSGADATMIPVSLQFAHYHRTRIDVVGNQETDEAIIGRDILNHLVVTLDGLANAVLVQK